MAMTKTEAAKLTNDMLLRGVIETIIQESSVLQVLPFEDVTGTAITYNRENAAPTVAFYAVGDTWTESTPTFTQETAVLKILGGDADVDNFLQQTYRDPNDLEAEVISLKAKATAYEFSERFYIGDAANELEGVRWSLQPGRNQPGHRDGHQRSSADARQARRADRHGQAGATGCALHGEADTPQALQSAARQRQPARNRCR